ncbi:succinyldiaminopimelate transaminase [Catellatospora sp. KI3]|uniref:succinyldiaminopimelate transaminase n=1 Tax=Catellatospora sp. KI3 TaxID=3041620 RepID=UPI0024822677|nr:succinyldiaminopimelate transaminase [Catellatospora sp. KI3]MDI1459869.1 succinyldiaminopimelate transaminase [Catellatospora sp. KI3]
MSTGATGSGRRRVSAGLPDFPWDLLEPSKRRAAAHPDGIVDLSIGTPVDPVPALIRTALAEASDSPGYPLTAGTPELRQEIAAWTARACRAEPGFAVLPSIGSKELVGWLPTLLGLGPDDTVVIPEICYPTYEVGVRLAGARVLRADTPPAGERPALIWINSPGNPHGRVASAGEMRAWIGYARETGAVLASDECYLTLPWTAQPESVLSLCGGDYAGVLAVHSLSKRSNLAGYRAGFVAGDPGLVGELLAVRKHAGMIMPAPVQAAMIAALADESHADEQRLRYAARRELLLPALQGAGFTVDHSEAGLYLWVTRGEACWDTTDWFADRGILVAPGEIYGPKGARHVRVALTATDERVRTVVARLS